MRPPRFESLQTGRLHAAGFCQPLNIPNVYGAPDAGFAAWSKTDGVTEFIDRFADAIDPTETERFVDRFGPGDAASAGILFVIADP